MISRRQAEELMEQYLKEINEIVPGGVTLMLDHTLERPYGWVFFYNSRRFFETGDPLDSLGGNSPVLIEATDGRMTLLGTAWPVEDSLKMLESERDLLFSTRGASDGDD